jgi:diguanylate cyclase (GGDEF)-like protein
LGRWIRGVYETLTFVNMPIRRKFTLFSLGVSFWLVAIAVVGLTNDGTWTFRGAILISAFTAHVLLLLFAISITRSLTLPISAMIEQIRILTQGDLNTLERIVVASGDEVGELSARFNRLLDALHEINSFKKVIEEDDTTEDVYLRLSRIFSTNGLERHVIYEEPAEGGGLSMVAGTETGKEWCRAEVRVDGSLCRAKKTGVLVASAFYPQICKQFAAESQEHICVPIIIGGSATGVVQFLSEAKDHEDPSELRSRIEKAERFLKEAVPVLEAKRLTQTLRESAIHDPLTGLYNRRFLEEYRRTLISQARRRGTAIGFLMCDIDKFKEINDTYGHEVGDHVLREISGVITEAVRTADIVMRWGGEEFLVVLSDVSESYLMTIAERARQAVEADPILADGHELQRTISIGVSLYPTDAADLAECINFADIAMYRAKVQGRNKVVRHRPEEAKPQAPPEAPTSVAPR